MTTETESPVVETVAPAPGAEVHVPLSLMGRKVVLKQDTDVMLGNILPAGASGFVIRHTSPLTNDNPILYVGWDQRPTGSEEVDEAYNWFVGMEDVEFVESPDTDGLPVVHLIGNLVDDDGVILMDGSVGFVVDGGNPNSQVLTVAFPEQDYRRFAGVVGGFDDLVFHHINGADLAFVAP